jgi:DNA polymerase (family 10)
MKNAEIARVFDEVAAFLEMRDVEWKPRAYRQAARRLEQMPEPVEDVHERGELEAIDGVGESMADKIREYLAEGEIGYHRELKDRYPIDVLALERVEGLGPARIEALYEHLGVQDLDDLEEGAREGRVSEVPGFGEALQERVLAHTGLAREGSERELLGKVLPTARELVTDLGQHPAVGAVEAVGSVRRWRPTVGDVDLLARPEAEGDAEAAIGALTEREDVTDVIASGESSASVRLRSGLQVDLRLFEPDAYGAALLYFTGSKSHNIALRRRAQKRGWKLNEYGLHDEEGQRLAGEAEAGVYEALDLAWVAPELREDLGEVEAAARDELPPLVTQEEIRGDLQMHTEWSDGAGTIREMAEAAAELGHDYILLTDHGPDLRVAGGPEEDDIAEIRQEAEAASEATGVRVLVGIEANIQAKGGLDVSDRACRELDLVVASLHTRAEDATERMAKAISEHPVDVLAHPTNRRIGRREPNELDLDRLAEVCERHRVALEINSQPNRLDLPWRQVHEHRDDFVWMISTDAHSPGQLARQHLGVAQARKAWLTREHVLNTRSAEEVVGYLRG